MYFFRYAVQVSIDDEILIQENDMFITAKVINISSFAMQGILLIDNSDTLTFRLTKMCELKCILVFH